ncbi:hypothetical protein BHM03_00030258 [Ensete ventricosum]|nr:hypothetical protein BHM03_00030258 [Ensete ventricosum]
MVEEPTKAGFAGGGDRKGEDEQVVNPWEVTAKDGGKIDYDKLIEKFGCQRLDESLVRRVERLTGRPAHVFLRRGVFFAHRSGSLVLGWFLIGTSMRFLMSMRGARSSSCTRGEGRPPRRCIWGIWCPSCSPSRYPCRAFYENMVKVAKCVTFNKIFLPYLNIIYCLQAVPSFPSSFPHLFSGKDNLRCLIPCAIDQVDIPVKYLGFFLEDDAELDHIKKEYGAGRMLTGEVKKRLVEVLSELVERHRKARALVTDEVSN